MSFNPSPSSGTPGNEAVASDRTSNLLNLLKFNPQSGRPDISTPQRASSESVPKGHTRDISASDFSPVLGQSTTPTRQHSVGAGNPAHSKNTPDVHQNMLLNLLKHPDQSSSTKTGSSPAMRPTRPSPTFGKSENGRPIPFQPSTASGVGPGNAYRNPFDRSYSPSHRQSPAPQKDTGVKPNPSGLSNGRDKTEIRGNPGVGDDKRESVSDALHEVASTADKEARNILRTTGAERESTPGLKSNAAKENSAQQELKEAVHEAAVELRDELEDGKTKAELKRDVSEPVASAIQETAGMIAQSNVTDSWENAEDEEIETPIKEPLKVYNFPMKPYVSIDVKTPQDPACGVRKEIVMKIATLKKGFDQSDRNLVSASPTFIVYTMTKGGGFRIIRQEDGGNKHVFRNGDNQMFSVSLSAPMSSHHSAQFETIVASGKDGSTYWAQVPLNSEGFDETNLENHGFILPPSSNSEDNTSNGQMKTRAKPSSRHPEFFAISRGRTIHIIPALAAPYHPYADKKSRLVDTEKLFNDRNLKIQTGKASKDFTFSGDDTVIVSLDKRGQVQFWDITAHTEKLEDALQGGGFCSVESKTPILSHKAIKTYRKLRPTSVQLVDKEKPTTKAVALRYMLVGLNQNHTIQLWDLGLGKAVQELNLPHQNDMDAVCTITYHARTGIIVVGHPTRNSLYLIHLSAPRYNLPALSQSSYIHCLVSGANEMLPKPESTAIMSGVREISLGSVGDFRSLDILSSPPEKQGNKEETVFELYVMHSRGVACLTMKRQDLGWDRDGRVIDGRNALEEGMISVQSLHQAASLKDDDDNSTKSDDELLKSSTQSRKTDVPSLSQEPNGPLSKSSQVNGTEKGEKKKKKKKGDTEEREGVITRAQAKATGTHDNAFMEQTWTPEQDWSNGPEPSQDTKGSEGHEKKLEAALDKPKESSMTQSHPPSYQEDIPQYDSNTQSLPNILDGQFRHLYRRIDDERRAFDAASSAKYESILRLVASTLTDNVDKSLSQIITSKVKESVIPSISQDVSRAFEQQLSVPLSKQLDKTVPREVKAASEGAFAKALQDPHTLRKITESVSGKLSTHVEKELQSALKNVIMPSFKDVATQAATQAASETQAKTKEQLNAAEKRRANDSAKIDNLAKLVDELTSTVKTMAGAQTGFQDEITSLRTQIAEQKLNVEPERPAAPVKSERDEQRESITQLMAERKWEDATVQVRRTRRFRTQYKSINWFLMFTQWLQSGRQSELFEEVLVHQPPQYLRMLSPILGLSVAASLTQNIESSLTERLMWLEIILGNTDAQASNIKEKQGREAVLITTSRIPM
ncbi:MAG: hypothetical protein M1831_007035 [Alyxoria varia]|nr:MAG: hypothetical protein M1831_007035 [Alyxoria varia]